MKKYTFKIILYPLLLLSSVSCTKWLDVKPEDRVTDQQLFSSLEGFLTALNGVYIELNSRQLYGGDLTVDAVEILAQRYDFSGNTTNPFRLGTYNYELDYSKNKFAGIWEKAYAQIANCNKILAYAESNEHVLTGEKRDLILGETLGLRAFLHFDLLRLFGPIYSINSDADAIPYNTRFSISGSDILSAKQVVDQVIADLLRAEEMLQAVDPIMDLGPQNSDSEDGLNHDTYRSLRFNYYAVKALQARVYLYAGENQLAADAARTVLAIQDQWFPFTPYSAVMGDVRNADRIFSSEVLFAAYHPQRNDIFLNLFGPELQPSMVYSPKGNLHTFFQDPDRDWRFSSTWIQTGGQAYRNFHKYESISSFNYINNLIPLMRITELYYILAETSTDSAEALNAINTVLYNRGLNELTDPSLIEATVREEYKREFWGEGQLFFYYKRINQPTIYSFSQGMNINMTNAQYVIPMPLTETDFRF